MENNCRILSVDIGFSAVKVSYRDENGLLRNDKYISSIAKLPDEPLEADNDTVFKLGLDWYILGPNSLKIARSYLLNLDSFEDLKLATPVWISYLLKKYSNMKWDRMAIGLSRAWADKSDELLSYLYETLLIDPSSNFFILLCQGVVAKACYSMYGENIRDTSHATDTKLSSYVILDGGYQTIDISCVIDSKSSAGATIALPDTGVVCISRKLQDYIYREYGFRVSIKESQTTVDSGTLLRRGREYRFEDKVAEFSKEYLIETLNILEDRYSEYLDVSSGVLVLGGLAYIFAKYIDHPDFIEAVEQHFPISYIHFPKYDGEFYNSISYLLIAEDLMNKK